MQLQDHYIGYTIKKNLIPILKVKKRVSFVFERPKKELEVVCTTQQSQREN